jgi:secreted PhoX family phosphatase
MKRDALPAVVSHDEDEMTNFSSNPTFESVLNARLSRRRALFGGMNATALAVLGTTSLAACGGGDDPAPAPPPIGGTPTPTPTPTPTTPPVSLSFNPVAKSLADAVVVSAGYTASVLYRLGDPIAAGVDTYKNDGTDAADTYDKRAGDHHDGMHYFGMNASGAYDAKSSTRALLAINHEAISPLFLHPTGPTITGTGAAAVRTVAGEVLKEFYVHGVSVIEINRDAAGKWSYKPDASFNRRVHTLTEMTLSGPAAKSSFMITKYSPDGSKTRGTINNCAHGYTPWGTYLTCEENWAGYFRRIEATDNPKRTAKELASFTRYGVRGNGRELWATVTPDTPDNLYGRWNAELLGASADGSDDYRNAPNTYGWTVEIDPFAPTSTPKKRTALGRFAHEGAWLGPVAAGKPLVWYQGCDSRNEYIYKFVSTALWDPADATKGLAAGDKYLDSGKLYAAKFNADGTGTWLELTFGTGNVTANNPAYAFANQADVLINARLAADAAGATKMDRPEWGAVNPKNGEVYMTLTNNSQRTVAAADAANPRVYNDPRTTGTAQVGNPNGHIIRWAENGADVAATAFKWDVFLFGARAGKDAANINLSALTADNDFSSPDGLWFSQANPGLLWIQTDDGAYTDVTNCMLLAAIPGTVGDGAKATVTASDGTTTKTVETFVGKPLGDTNLKRFLVGPKDCEITGIDESPDGTAIFVNIQHPGEDTAKADFDTGKFTSNWPDGGTSRPRSATIVITKDGGGKVGV